MTVNRNTVQGFATNTLENLAHIEAKYGAEGIHVVTQIANSMLGLIVFPWEKRLKKDAKGDIARKKMKDLVNDGWPSWTIAMGTCSRLGCLIYHLRNAASHGSIEFSSDDPDPSQITITVKDRKPDSQDPYWIAEIGALELRSFCLRFIKLLQTSGTQI